MGFSEKMRDSLGAEGARIEVTAPSHPTAAGTVARIGVDIVGGTKAVAVDAIVVRLFEAHRHWIDATGASLTEDEAQARNSGPQGREDKPHVELVPTWDKAQVAEQRIDVGTMLDPGQRHTMQVELAVPAKVAASSPACTHTVLVQADIKGQIDPTGQVRIAIGPAGET
jgi:hypothetical protein